MSWQYTSSRRGSWKERKDCYCYITEITKNDPTRGSTVGSLIEGKRRERGKGGERRKGEGRRGAKRGGVEG